MRPTKLAAAGATVALVAAGAAVAHHSFSAEFDPDKPLRLTGRVTEMKWSNPHAWIYLDVTGADGKVQNWACETNGANGLFRRGWRKDDLPAGTTLVVEGWQARNGSLTVNVGTVTFPDGKRLFAGSSNPTVVQQN